MLLECLIKREGATEVSQGGAVFSFQPRPELTGGDEVTPVCEVASEPMQKRLLESGMYREYERKETKKTKAAVVPVIPKAPKQPAEQTSVKQGKETEKQAQQAPTPIVETEPQPSQPKSTETDATTEAFNNIADALDEEIEVF